jgi:hypothetical protein
VPKQMPGSITGKPVRARITLKQEVSEGKNGYQYKFRLLLWRKNQIVLQNLEWKTVEKNAQIFLVNT